MPLMMRPRPSRRDARWLARKTNTGASSAGCAALPKKVSDPNFLTFSAGSVEGINGQCVVLVWISLLQLLIYLEFVSYLALRSL